MDVTEQRTEDIGISTNPYSNTLSSTLLSAAKVGPTEVSSKDISKRDFYYNFGLVSSLFFLWGFSYGLLDVLNKHFQVVFNISKLQSTALQVMYFGAYLVFSPVAGIFMNKFGYKKGIYMGLGFFSTGALMFWPSAHYEVFGGFLGATWIIGCGLCTLEVAANSYIAVLGDAKNAPFRLNFAQSWNGLALFIGPLIASKYFFTGENANSLVTVQYVYLAVACLAGLIAILFFFATLPEVSDNVLEAELIESGLESKSFLSNTHLLLGFVCQFCYMAAQVSTAAFVINYLSDDGLYTDSEASNIFAYLQITFLVARFVSTPILKFVDETTVLFVYGLGLTLFSFLTVAGGKLGVASLFLVFFFESVCYPLIFVLATSRLGKWSKKGAGLMVAAVGGGMVGPVLQGALSSTTISLSYLIPSIFFSAVPMYALYMMRHHKRRVAVTIGGESEPAPSIKEEIEKV